MPKENKTLYNVFADKYNHAGFLASWAINSFYKSLNEKISILKPQGAIHEVACGAGFSTEKIHAMLSGNPFTASEFEEELVPLAQVRNPKVKISQESIYEIKAQDKEYDLILALEVLEHLKHPEIALAELSRVSNHAIISVPNEPLWRIINMARGKYLLSLGNTPGHINHWTPWQFRSLVSMYFKVIDSSYPAHWQILICESYTK